MDAKKTKKLNKEFVAAAASGNIGRMDRLLTEGAGLEGTGGFWHSGETALLAAAKKGQHLSIAYLVQKGANIEAVNGDGNTPLMLAISSKEAYTTEQLLKAGASTKARNSAGKTALDLALATEYTRLTALVREYIATREAAERQAQEAVERQERRKAEQAVAASRPKPVETVIPVAPKPVIPPPPAPKKEDPDIVIFRQQAGDRVLEDVFNFVSFERVTFVRKEQGAPVEAMTRQGFSEVENRDYLKKAFTEHVRRGGTVQEEDIFAVTKPKISKLQETTP